MGWLNKIKEGQKHQRISAWKMLTSQTALQQADQDSFSGPVILFKHSTACGTSARAKYILEEEWNGLIHDVQFYFLDLLQFRALSNQIAETYEVTHHSPQIIVLSKGAAIYHTSHHRISIDDLNEQLGQYFNGTDSI